MGGGGAGVGEIAAPAARDTDFLGHFVAVVHQQDLLPQLPGHARAKQASGTGADDDNIKHFHAAIVTRLLQAGQARGLGLERQGVQTLATLRSRVSLHSAKNKFNNNNRYKFEVIVKASNLLAKR